MTNLTDRPRLRRLLVSNLADASSTQFVDLTLIMLAVAALGLSAGQNGLLNALGSASFLLLALPAGLAVDHVGPAVCLRISLTIKAAVTIAALALVATSSISIGWTMGLVTALGVASVLSENAQVAMVPLLGAGEQIGSTVAALMAADRAVTLVAPLAAGLALARQWQQGVLGLAVAAALLALVLVPRVTRRAVPSTEPGQGWLDSLREGRRAFAAAPLLVAVTVLAAAGNAGLAIGSAVEAVLVLQRLGLGTGFFGLLSSAGAATGLAAAAGAARVLRRAGAHRVFVGGALVQLVMATLPLLALCLPGASRPLLLVHAVGWAGSMTLTNVATAAHTASVVPPALIGRVAALRQLVTMGVVPLASLVAGLLADAAGMWAPLVVWPCCTVVGLVGYTMLSRRRAD